MSFTIAEDAFATEEEAIAEIEARGWHPLTLDVDIEAEDLHWHDFDSVVYVVRGRIQAELADGSRVSAGAGSRFEAHAGVLHREVDSHYRMVIGLDRPAGELTQPLNKPPADLPA